VAATATAKAAASAAAWVQPAPSTRPR
jgi:hypothetical protein